MQQHDALRISFATVIFFLPMAARIVAAASSTDFFTTGEVVFGAAGVVSMLGVDAASGDAIGSAGNDLGLVPELFCG